jgi:peptide deformylase
VSDQPTAPVEELDDELATESEAPEGLDAETLERRAAALAQVVKFGAPVLKSAASPVTEFDDELAAEGERMIGLMRDAIGVGLAATQLGTLRRMLVFQVGSDAQPTILVNPEIEWRSDDLATAEEGCLSLPGVVVDVERPLHVRARAGDVRGEPLSLEASGLEAGDPARGRSPRWGPDARSDRPRPAEGCPEGVARGRHLRPEQEEETNNGGPPAEVETAYLGTSGSRQRFCKARRASTGRSSSSRRPTAGVAGDEWPAARGGGGAELDLEVHQTPSVNSPESVEAIRAANPTRSRCARSPADQGPLLSEYLMLNVHPSLIHAGAEPRRSSAR